MTGPPSGQGVWAPEWRGLTVGLVLTVTLVAFEALAVSTVMPLVARELNGLRLYGWVFSAFFLANLVGIVLAGSVLDSGRLAGSLVLGLALFGAGLVLGGLAPSMELLVAGRVLQGFGAGFEAPVAYTAIGRVYPEAARPRMFATLSTAWVLPGIMGPALAGLVGEQLGWRWVLLGLLPLIAVAGVMTVPALRRVERAPTARTVASTAAPGAPPGQGMPVRSDLARRLGLAVAIAAGAGLLVGGLGSASVIPGLPLAAAGAAIAGPAFARLTPSGTLRARPVLPAAVLLRGLLTCSFFAADAYVPLALVAVRGTTAATAGIALTAATVSWTAGAWLQARGVVRLGARRFVRAGFATVLVGIALTGLVLLQDVPIPIGIAGWGVAGLGMGLAYAPITLTVLREAGPGGQGRASAALQLSDVLGTALGAGLGGTLIALVAGSAALATGGAAADPRQLAVGMVLAFAVGAATSLVGVGLSGRLDPARPARADVRPGTPAVTVEANAQQGTRTATGPEP